MAHNSENVSPFSSESTLTESKVISVGDYASATPAPSYGSHRSSMESFASSDLPSMHSEVASEYSTVLSAIASIGLHSSVSTRYPSSLSLAEIEDTTVKSLRNRYIPSVVNSEDADLIDYALTGDARDEHSNQKSEAISDGRVKFTLRYIAQCLTYRSSSLSPISLYTELTIPQLPDAQSASVSRGVQRLSIDLASRGQIGGPSTLRLRRSNAMPGFLDQISQGSDSSGFATSSPSMACSDAFDEQPVDNLANEDWAANIGSERSGQVSSSNGKQTDNALSPCILFGNSSDGMSQHSTLDLCETKYREFARVSYDNVSKLWVGEDENCVAKNVARNDVTRKRTKNAFDPASKVGLDKSVSSDDVSLHSFKLRRLRDVITHTRQPDIETGSPLQMSANTSSTIADVDSSSTAAGHNSSLFLSSGDSSRDEVLLSLSIARAFRRPRLPSHCPTPMTNASSPSPPKYNVGIIDGIQSSNNSSQLESSNTSEENSLRDDEIIKELTARAFATQRASRSDLHSAAALPSLRGCLVVDSLATSSCSSPKVKKKVRFNNEPAIMSFQWSPECDTITEERTVEIGCPDLEQQSTPTDVIHDGLPQFTSRERFSGHVSLSDSKPAKDLPESALEALPSPSAVKELVRDAKSVVKFPVMRETRSSQLRAQLCQRRMLGQSDLRGKRRNVIGRKRNRDVALSSPGGSSASSVVSRPTAHKLVRKQ